MKFGSLFSGIGGFDLGFERAGMECAWQCEIDKNCQDVLTKKFGVKIYDDVRTITAGNTEPVDVICGGFPCQDVSIAGKRAGFAGERSGLWSEFARIIEELKPGWVIIENVPGLLSSNQGRDFQTVLDQMVEYGYGVCWRILDAQYFGVAQRRRRVFVVGSLGNGRSAEVLFESEGVRWNPPPRRQTGEEIAGTLGGGSGERGWNNSLDTASFIAYENHPNDSRITETGGGNVPLVAHTLTFCDANGTRKDRPNGGLYVKEVDQSNTLSGAGEGGVLVSGYRMTAFGEYADDDKAGALKQRDWKDATDIIATSRTLRQGKEGGGKGYLGSEEKAMTLGGQQQYVGVRHLTPTECARLQGFPDDWNEWLSDSARYRQFGNAVCVNVAEWIGKLIIQGESK